MNDFASRLRRVAQLLRWTVGTMVLSFGVAWFAAARGALILLRVAVLAGAVAFIVATLCFVWLAWQAVSRRRAAQPADPRRDDP